MFPGMEEWNDGGWFIGKYIFWQLAFLDADTEFSR